MHGKDITVVYLLMVKQVQENLIVWLDINQILVSFQLLVKKFLKGFINYILNNRINLNENDKLHYEVYVSMLEIYNERVHDLLTHFNTRTPAGLKIREN